jgi:hypothetical protein
MTPHSLSGALVVGAIAFGYLVGALFFLKFRRRTGDRLFAAFAAAFLLMAINQAAPILFGIPDEALGGVYLLRLAAFVLIIGAIVRKNLTRS